MWKNENNMKLDLCEAVDRIALYVFCADDMNWNALEWDRAAEELTWERVRLLCSCQRSNQKLQDKY